MSDLRARFEERYFKNPDGGCWIWTGQVHRGAKRLPYGRIADNKTVVLAHRLSYEIYVGSIPTGLCVCHTCDVPRCVNPQHLFLATKAENNADRAAKGRNADFNGEKSPVAKLSLENVAEIKRLVSAGTTQSGAGRQFGVTQTTISKIMLGKKWKSVGAA